MIDIDINYFQAEDVRLEIFNDKHILALCEQAKDKRIWQSHREDFHVPEVYLAKRIQKIKKEIQNETRITFVIFYKNQLIGKTSYYNINLKHLTTDIGYTWLHPDYWGKGINQVIKKMMLSYAIEHLKFKRVSFCIDAENLASRRAVEKLNIPFEGILKKHYIRPDGSSRDSAIYAVTDDVWIG